VEINVTKGWGEDRLEFNANPEVTVTFSQLLLKRATQMYPRHLNSEIDHFIKCISVRRIILFDGLTPVKLNTLRNDELMNLGKSMVEYYETSLDLRMLNCLLQICDILSERCVAESVSVELYHKATQLVEAI